MYVTAEDGRELDASFFLERAASGVDLIIAARSGASKGAPAGRNSDYEKGVDILLGRLAQWRVVLAGVSLDSTLARNLPSELRQLELRSFGFPLELAAVKDIRSLRLDVRRATIGFGQSKGAIGGNPTKRLRLHLDWAAASDVRLEALEVALGTPASVLVGTRERIAIEARAAVGMKELRRRVEQGLPAVSPVGGPGGLRVRTAAIYYPRKDEVIAWVRHSAGGRCEVCAEGAPFLKDDGEPYLEVHHVRPLADGGPDQIDNAIAACPTCHRRLHFGADRHALRLELLVRIPRLVDYPKTAVIDLPIV